MFRISYMPGVHEDMVAVREYTLTAFSPAQYEKLRDQLRASIGRLASLPKLGRISDYDGRFRQLSVGAFIVFYTVDEGREQVVIHHIWHGIRNIRHLLDSAKWDGGTEDL